MNVINPFSSPRKVKTDLSTAAKCPALTRVLVFGYLAIFCSLHVVPFFEVVWRGVNHGRLSWLHVFSCAVPALAAASIGLYALGVRPKRYIHCWQAVPYLVFMYALMASRLAYDEFGLVSAGFITTTILALILYGPAVYMSHRAASSQDDWDIELQRSQPPANREQLTKKLLVFVPAPQNNHQVFILRI